MMEWIRATWYALQMYTGDIGQERAVKKRSRKGQVYKKSKVRVRMTV